jgi:hypothetical protein
MRLRREGKGGEEVKDLDIASSRNNALLNSSSHRISSFILTVPVNALHSHQQGFESVRVDGEMMQTTLFAHSE